MLSWYILFAGLWCLVNGILHDVFVLREGRPFDRELIRLLIDGHILIFSGVLFLFCFRAVGRGEAWAYYVSVLTAVFILGYCALIFRLLPSVGTLAVHLVALVWLLIGLQKIKP